jgi:hypothetical protein
MKALLYLLSILWIAGGTMLVLYTDATRRCLKDFVYRTDTRMLALAPTLIGLLLIVGAMAVPGIFTIGLFLGILALAKGAFLGFAPLDMVHRLREWWMGEASETSLRFWGLVVFTLGITLFSWLF